MCGRLIDSCIATVNCYSRQLLQARWLPRLHVAAAAVSSEYLHHRQATMRYNSIISSRRKAWKINRCRYCRRWPITRAFSCITVLYRTKLVAIYLPIACYNSRRSACIVDCMLGARNLSQKEYHFA